MSSRDRFCSHLRTIFSHCFPKDCGLRLVASARKQRFDIAGDKPRSPLVAQIEPRPFRHYDEAPTKANQIVNVHTQPDQPRDEARPSESSDLSNRRSPANVRETAFVDVMRWLDGLTTNDTNDIPGGMAALLDRSRW